MSSPSILLSRELRFGLHEFAEAPPLDSNNGFAGVPALVGLGPFLTLTAVLSGQVDPQTGMLVNIKVVDRVLRQEAVPMLRTYYYHPLPALRGVSRGAADLLPLMFNTLKKSFAPHVLESLTLALSPYLLLRVDRAEAPMVTLTQRFEFSASHRLHSEALSDADNRETFGRCNNPNGHGHNYELEVSISGTPDATGSLMPLHQFQQIVNHHVIDHFDHKHLNLDCPEFSGLNPTVENIARVIFDKLKRPLATPHVQLAHVRVYETPKTFCQVGG